MKSDQNPDKQKKLHTDEDDNQVDDFLKEAKRKKIYEIYVQNNKELNERIVFELIDLELKDKENIGQLLTQDYLTGKIDRNSCLVKLEKNGFTLWWGSESLWYLIRIEKYTVTHDTPNLLTVIAECQMEFVSTRIIIHHQKLRTQHSKISLSIDEKLEVKEFEFEWIEKNTIGQNSISDQ
jgi:hypothetical protein